MGHEISWLSRISITKDDDESFQTIGTEYQRLSELLGHKALPKLSFGGDALPVLRAIYWASSNPALESFVLSTVPFSGLAEELARLVDDEDEAVIVPVVLDFRRKYPAAFPREDTIALPRIRDKALAAVERAYAPQTKFAARALGIMARLTDKSAEVLGASLDAGNLQNRTTESVEAEDFLTAGVLIGTTIACGKAFDFDINEIEDSVGRNDFFAEIAGTLKVQSDAPLKAIWTALADGHSNDLMRGLIEFTVREHEFSPEELDEIADNPEFYLSPLDRNLRYQLSKKIGTDENRVQKIGRLHPSSLLTDILGALIRSGSADARNQSRVTVEGLPIETWMAYLSGSHDWVIELLDKCPKDFRLGANSNAVAAALQFIDSKSANLTVAERTRLKKLHMWLNGYGSAKLLDCLVKQGTSNPRHAISLFRQSSEQLDEHLSRRLNATQMTGLFGGLSAHAAGRGWLQDHLNPFQNAIKRFETKDVSEIGAWFRAQIDRTSRARANWLELMGNRLELDM